MLDWKRIYKFDEENALSLKDYTDYSGVVDWYKLLKDLVKRDYKVVYVPLEYHGSYTAAIEFSEVEISDKDRGRLAYRVLSLLCEMFRNLVELKDEHVKMKRDVKLYLSILNHNYKFGDIVITFDMQEMRLHVRAYDKGINKSVKATVYTKDEEKELNLILDELHECKSSEAYEIVVDKINSSDVEGSIINIWGSDSFDDILLKLPDEKGDLYLSFEDEIYLKVTKYSGSELHKLSVICESCWFLGYTYLIMSESLCDFVDRTFNMDVIQTVNYKLKFFKGDFGIVRKE